MVFYQCNMHKKLGWIIQARPLSTLSRSAPVCARNAESAAPASARERLPAGMRRLNTAPASPPSHVPPVSASAANAAARAQVVDPDGRPANRPNTNNATVAGLAPLSQAVINPSMIAARPCRSALPCGPVHGPARHRQPAVAPASCVLDRRTMTDSLH